MKTKLFIDNEIIPVNISSSEKGIIIEKLDDKKEKLQTLIQKHSELLLKNGWRCPKCGSIYSPYISECRNCNKNNFMNLHKN